MQDGKPLVPAIVVDGQVTSVLHPAQVASLVGLPTPGGVEPARLCWDLVTILEAWIEEIEVASWDVLVTPTPSRDRTLAHLTVNVFLPITLLPTAWSEEDFPWHPEEDDPKVEATLDGQDDYVAYARSALALFTGAVMDLEAQSQGADPVVTSPRGGLPLSQLLMSQRWHAAFHLCQLLEFYKLQGLDRVGSFDPRRLPNLDIPEDVFGGVAS